MKTPGLLFSELRLNITALRKCLRAASCPTLLSSWFTRRLAHHAPHPQVCPSLAAAHLPIGATTPMTHKKRRRMLPSDVPAGVFNTFSPPGGQINIWMIMIAVGWVPTMVEGGWLCPGSLLISQLPRRQYLPTSLYLSAACCGLISFDLWLYVSCISRPPTDLECVPLSRKSAGGQPGLFSQ